MGQSRRPLLRLSASAVALLLAGCLVVPQTVEVYDPDCRMRTKQVVLETAVVGGFHSCAGDGCVAMLATLGFITAASVVVSGSIAIVGNVVYWAEKQGQCVRSPAPAGSAPAR
jgi:starvation-inducible outer membrane lipoprotein